eukprot:3561492-Rhodomonas_salina.1
MARACSWAACSGILPSFRFSLSGTYTPPCSMNGPGLTWRVARNHSSKAPLSLSPASSSSSSRIPLRTSPLPPPPRRALSGGLWVSSPAIVLRLRYALCGTDVGYAATRLVAQSQLLL